MGIARSWTKSSVYSTHNTYSFINLRISASNPANNFITGSGEDGATYPLAPTQKFANILFQFPFETEKKNKHKMYGDDNILSIFYLPEGIGRRIIFNSVLGFAI